MKFKIIDGNGVHINTVSASKHLVQEYCTVHGYTYEAIVQGPESPGLEEIKRSRIRQSKDDLATYLEANPLQWTDGNLYAITAEKQQQLTSKLMAATMAAATGGPYILKWNATGDVCQEWALEDLTALAFAIDARVTALVEYQQAKELDINAAGTQEELDSIVVDYSTVEFPA